MLETDASTVGLGAVLAQKDKKYKGKIDHILYIRID
jgi:hypothetical protein